MADEKVIRPGDMSFEIAAPTTTDAAQSLVAAEPPIARSTHLHIYLQDLAAKVQTTSTTQTVFDPYSPAHRILFPYMKLTPEFKIQLRGNMPFEEFLSHQSNRADIAYLINNTDFKDIIPSEVKPTSGTDQFPKYLIDFIEQEPLASWNTHLWQVNRLTMDAVVLSSYNTLAWCMKHGKGLLNLINAEPADVTPASISLHRASVALNMPEYPFPIASLRIRAERSGEHDVLAILRDYEEFRDTITAAAALSHSALEIKKELSNRLQKYTPGLFE